MNNPNLGYYFKRINEAFVANKNRNLKCLDLTAAQFDVLVYLLENRKKPCTQRNIELFFGLSHPTIFGILQRLKEKGYVVLNQCNEDKRQKIVCLTEKAHDAGNGIRMHMNETDEWFKQNMSDEEIQDLIKKLNKVYDILKRRNNL